MVVEEVAQLAPALSRWLIFDHPELDLATWGGQERALLTS